MFHAYFVCIWSLFVTLCIQIGTDSASHIKPTYNANNKSWVRITSKGINNRHTETHFYYTPLYISKLWSTLDLIINSLGHYSISKLAVLIAWSTHLPRWELLIVINCHMTNQNLVNMYRNPYSRAYIIFNILNYVFELFSFFILRWKQEEKPIKLQGYAIKSCTCVFTFNKQTFVEFSWIIANEYGLSQGNKRVDDFFVWILWFVWCETLNFLFQGRNF